MKYFLSMLYVAPCALAWVPTCIPVESGHILARHLAQANPAFAALDATLEIAYAPRNGITRVIRAAELAQVARRNGIEAPAKLSDACFTGSGQTAALSKAADREVERGERVAVEVSSGGAWLTFEAEAASSGRDGESVVVKNPENGRLFSAKVKGKGKVVIQR